MFVLLFALLTVAAPAVLTGDALPRIRIAPGGRGFVTAEGRPFVPMGVNWFRPGTGWAPQVWRQFDPEATRRDFAKLRELGGNCVRVFLTYGSFYETPGTLSADGLAKFDRFLELAGEAGIYVHPTGPDHWEGLPAWARGDRIAEESVLVALEQFWRLFAARYRGHTGIFAYDLLNEPEVRWDGAAMQQRWNAWLREKHGDLTRAQSSWGGGTETPVAGELPVPPRDEKPGPRLLDYQRCREAVADAWTRRQAAAIRAADPQALVTVGLIQWSVPVMLGGAWQYSGFRPSRQAPMLDFLEVHFYPLANGFYTYAPEDEARNLAYLATVVREVAACGKPVVLAEFGWYGGGKPSIDGGRHPFADEEQQARWCRRAVESTAGPVQGWLNWGFHDHAGARDVTEFIGLLTAEGREKAWAREFRRLAGGFANGLLTGWAADHLPRLDWDALITDPQARDEIRQALYRSADARRVE